MGLGFEDLGPTWPEWALGLKIWAVPGHSGPRVQGFGPCQIRTGPVFEDLGSARPGVRGFWPWQARTSQGFEDRAVGFGPCLARMGLGFEDLGLPGQNGRRVQGFWPCQVRMDPGFKDLFPVRSEWAQGSRIWVLPGQN